MGAKQLLKEGMDRIENLLAPDDAKVFKAWRSEQETKLDQQYKEGYDNGYKRKTFDQKGVNILLPVLSLCVIAPAFIGGGFAFRQMIGELNCPAPPPPIQPEQHDSWFLSRDSTLEKLVINKRVVCFRSPKAKAFSCVIKD